MSTTKSKRKKKLKSLQAAAETAFRESLKYTGMRSRLFSYGVLAEWST